MAERKLFVVIGITGNQGGSVAKTFLDDPEMRSKYRLRGITRDPTSSQSQKLISQGVEMVSANLHDQSTLLKAFEGAHVIFSVTDFWKPYFDEKNQAKAREQGKHIGELCYELEYEQGRNIADAASKTPTLERLVVSMVCSTKERSNGIYSKIYHFDAKADMISYIKSTHPALAAKMSELNMGVFMTAWRFTPSLMAPQKMEDGVHVLRLPCNPDTPIPFVDAGNDTGPFVRTLLALEPGVHLYGAVTLMSWNEWLTLWGRIMGKKTRFQLVTVEFWEEEMAKWAPQGFGTEIAEMFEFMGKYGYDGGDPECKRWWELVDAVPGISSVEGFIKNEDWSSVVGN
ncbi:hypothetical protein CJF32_00008506 [Rutstroemia sp. NJR-2017a WRK4]|nr:hypothetical protein CJF32_00008506 [Rutstroemia sp. NJR-2017a WRK4]